MIQILESTASSNKPCWLWYVVIKYAEKIKLCNIFVVFASWIKSNCENIYCTFDFKIKLYNVYDRRTSLIYHLQVSYFVLNIMPLRNFIMCSYNQQEKNRQIALKMHKTRKSSWSQQQYETIKHNVTKMWMAENKRRVQMRSKIKFSCGNSRRDKWNGSPGLIAVVTLLWAVVVF